MHIHNDVIKLNALKFYCKYMNHELRSYFCRFQLTRQGSGHTYDTRQGDQIRTTRTRINFEDHCLWNHFPSLINSTPPNIMSKITTHSLYGFSIYFKKVTISNYPQIVKLQTTIFVTDLEKNLVNKILHSNDRPLFMSVQNLESSLTICFANEGMGLYAWTCTRKPACV